MTDEQLTCERCGVDCTAMPLYRVHNDGHRDGPVCFRCAAILNGVAR